MKTLVGVLLGLSAVLAAPIEDPGEYGDKFEGDMVLSENFDRTGLLDLSYRWTQNIVPYVLTDLTEEQAAYVRESLDEMERVTCLTFVERTTQTNYVNVITSESGCFSSVGMVGGSQRLNLASNVPGSGCFRKGTIIHEFLHALGVYHMQSATERDDYVTIVWENIEIGKEHNFRLHEADRVSQFGVPYDYGSVMHYSATAFSVNGEKTIVPNDPDAAIGQRVGMSDYDIQRINNMYC